MYNNNNKIINFIKLYILKLKLLNNEIYFYFELPFLYLLSLKIYISINSMYL